MRCLQEGDESAIATLMSRYQGSLFNYLVRMTGRHADAEDAFQETFIRVYRHANRFRSGARFRPWLYRIATNCCRDLLRKRRRERGLFAESSGNPASNPIDQTADPAPGPREFASRRDLADRLSDAVAKLPFKQRAVFLMARYDEMAYPEIARALRVPVGTVKSRMNAATKGLLEQLSNDDY